MVGRWLNPTVINTSEEVFSQLQFSIVSIVLDLSDQATGLCINRIFFPRLLSFTWFFILSVDATPICLLQIFLSSCQLSSTPFTGSCCLLFWYQRSCSCLLSLILLSTLFIFSTCPMSSHSSSWPIVHAALHDYNSTRLCPVVIHLLPKVMCSENADLERRSRSIKVKSSP